MRVWNFPTVPVSKQLFHVPGGAVEGGFTSGSVRMLSPEPGGRSVLELEIALSVREWEFPFASWLMSKGNGEVFRIRMAPTPQVVSAREPGTLWSRDVLWANHQPWANDITLTYATDALEGSSTVQVVMTGFGDIVRHGHVIGHGDSAYIVDDIVFDADTQTSIITVKPPLRRNITANDFAYFRPFFTGTISNIGEVRATYDASNNGAIQPGKFVFAEAIT